jgi:hypothetical protein
MTAPAEEAIGSILEGDGEPDEILRAVVAALVDHGGCAWAGIAFVEGGELVLGPHAGAQRASRRRRVPVVYRGGSVAELVADGCPDPALLEHVAPAIAAHCLVGWDTGGVPWDAVS